MTDLHIAKGCTKDHMKGESEDSKRSGSKMSDEHIDQIVERLYKTHTACSRGDDSPAQQSPRHGHQRKVTKEDMHIIIERLYKTHTQAMQEHPHEQMTAQDKISRGPVNDDTLDQIIERMYRTHTTASSGTAPRQPPAGQKRLQLSEEEINEIYQRLQTTHTKSSAGGQECRPWDPVKTPGLGLKMYPVIEGIETRFIGKNTTTDKVDEVVSRLMKTQTIASQARLDPPRILLYPERTTLCNNVERIANFQQSGAVANQAALQRREKWYK